MRSAVSTSAIPIPPAPMTARPMRSEGATWVAWGFPEGAGMFRRDSVRRTTADVSPPDSSDGRPAASAEPAATDLTKSRRLLAAGDFAVDLLVAVMVQTPLGSG